uniref:Uncharacterized protein n=1 Tax=Cucumis melo TaxID=3656 RepID=A0A9I9CDC4_CUCME
MLVCFASHTRTQTQTQSPVIFGFCFAGKQSRFIAMAGKEVREYTNLSDPKDKKWGKGKDKIDDEDITFQRMVAKEYYNEFEVRGLYNPLFMIWPTYGTNIEHLTADCFCRASLSFDEALNSHVLERTLLFSCTDYILQRKSNPKSIFLSMNRVPVPSNWFPDLQLYLQDLGFSYRVADTSRCKRLQENVEVTFMDEAFAALDSDDLLYLKEQMEAEEDAERLLRRTEKRAFAAFKISFFHYENLQQDLLKRVVEVKPKRPRVSNLSDLSNPKHDNNNDKVKENPLVKTNKTEGETEAENPVKSLLGLAYASSDDEDE